MKFGQVVRKQPGGWPARLLRRRLPALGTEVIEDPTNDIRIFDGSNDPDRAAALLTNLDIDKVN